MIDGHGNNIYNPANSVISDFSSNVAPCQPNLKILDHLTSKLNAISNYRSLMPKICVRCWQINMV